MSPVSSKTSSFGVTAISLIILMISVLISIATNKNQFAVDATSYAANGIFLWLHDITDTQIDFISIVNSQVIIGPNVVVGKFSFGLIANSNLSFTSTTCTGDTYFTGLATSANVTIDSCTFSAGAVRLGPLTATSQFILQNSAVTVPSSLTSINSAVQFTSDTEAKGVIKLVNNTIQINSTSTGFVNCIQFSPTNLTANSLVISNNTCIVNAFNPVGVLVKSAARIANDITIDSNTFTLTSNGAVGGVSNCIRFENFVYAKTSGFYYTNNKCTGRGTGNTDGVILLTTASLTTTSPVMENLKVTGNTFDLVDTGATGTAHAFSASFALPSGAPWGTSLCTFSNNTISLTAQRGVVAFDLAKGVNQYTALDVSSNIVNIKAAAASTTSTDYTAFVRIAQQNAGFAAVQLSASFYKNSVNYSGAYGPGFIAVGDGTGASTTKSVSGSWLFRSNTFVSTPTAGLFSPTMDVSNGAGNLTLSCNTYNGASLPSAQVATSISGSPAGYFNDVACNTCSYSLFCNQRTTSSVTYNSADGECYCRCDFFRTRRDPLPRGEQCRYRAGNPFTATRSLAETRSEELSNSSTLSISSAKTRSISKSISGAETSSTTMSITGPETRSKMSSASKSATAAETSSASRSSEATESSTMSLTTSSTVSVTPGETASATESLTKSVTPAETASATTSPTAMESATKSATQMKTASPMETASATPMKTATASATAMETTSATTSSTTSSSIRLTTTSTTTTATSTSTTSTTLTTLAPTTNTSTTTTSTTVPPTTTIVNTTNTTTTAAPSDDSLLWWQILLIALAGALLLLFLILLFCCCCTCCPWYNCCKGAEEPVAVEKDRVMAERYDGATFGPAGTIVPKDPLDFPVVDSYIDHAADVEEEDRERYDELMDMEPRHNGGELYQNRPARRNFILAEPSAEGQGNTPIPSPANRQRNPHTAVNMSNANHNNHNNEMSPLNTSPRRAVSVSLHDDVRKTAVNNNNNNNNNNDDGNNFSPAQRTPNNRMSPRETDSNYNGPNSHTASRAGSGTPRR